MVKRQKISADVAAPTDGQRVTAMMITGKCPERIPMARVAAECFMRQTYPHRRLVIINHGAEPLRVAPRKNHAHETVLCDEVMVTREQYPTLGDLRNLAKDLCLGGLICTWDDDDWMADTYMAFMASHYKPGRIVLMQYQLRHDLINNSSIIQTATNGHNGQVLYAANTPHRYPSRDRHEDSEFAEAFHTRRVALANDPAVYVRTCHGHNVCSRRHIMQRAEPLRDRHLVDNDEQLQLIRHVRALYGYPPDGAEPAGGRREG